MKTLCQPKVVFLQLSLLLAGTVLFAVVLPEGQRDLAEMLLFVIALALIMSLCASIYARTRSVIRSTVHVRAPRNTRTIWKGPQTNFALSDLHRIVPGRVDQYAEGIRFSRGRFGVWGSLIFHVGLVALIVGAIVSRVTGFSGSIALTEGESQEISLSGLQNTQAGILSPSLDEGKRIHLQRFDPRHGLGSSWAPASWIAVHAEEMSVGGVVHVNQAVFTDEYQIHQSDAWGYSPEVILMQGEEVIFHGFVRLAWPAGDTGKPHHDEIDLPDGSRLELALFPTLDRRASELRSLGNESIDPVLQLRVQKQDEPAQEYLLNEGRAGTVAGITAVFPSLRRWSQIDIGSDHGLSILLAGCILIVVGLAIRLLFVRKTIWIRIIEDREGLSITLCGRSEKYPASFERELMMYAYQIGALLSDCSADSQKPTTDLIFSG